MIETKSIFLFCLRIQQTIVSRSNNRDIINKIDTDIYKLFNTLRK